MNFPVIWNADWTAPLVNHLWQSTVVAAIAWLLALALRKNHARARYWVWFAAGMKFLLPFSLLMTAGTWLRPLIAAPIVTRPALANAMEQIAQPFPQMQFFDAVQTPIAAHHGNMLPSVLFAIWACGALIVAVRFGRGLLRVYTAKCTASPFALAADVPVLCSPAMIEPGIVGMFRPVLLLPEGILQRLTPEQLRAIVAHEMCHVRRRDNLTFAMHMAAEAMFWFHPAVWWVGAQLIEERERACDEAVLQSGSEAEDYAEGILNVCKFYVESPVACVSGVTGSDLKQRIIRIMAERGAFRLTWSKKSLLVAAVLMAVTVPVVLGLDQTATDKASWGKVAGGKQELISATGSLLSAQVSAPATSPTSAQSPAPAPATPGASAQDIVGIWQGTLHAGRDLRTELKIAKASDGSLKTTLYSIDQGGQPIPATKTTFENGELKYSIDVISGKFEGKMSADGKTITGTWTQGTNPLALTMERTTPDNAWPIPEPIKPMAANADPGFEVVTIKPSVPGRPGKIFGYDTRLAPGQFAAISMNMNDLVAFAYGLHSKQIVGAPDWFATDLFDVAGKPDVEGRPSLRQEELMVQKLLPDRFALKFHHEQRELSVYIITVAPGGPKMTKTAFGPNDPQGFGFRGLGDLVVRNLNMAEFAAWMQSGVTDKPVVDHTGLTDKYDFNLKWTPDDSQFAQFRGVGAVASPPSDDPNAPPSLYTAVQETLGLKIEAGKAMDDIIVIDHVEKPSPN